MLEGLDIALILDDVPGVVNHWFVRAATFHNWIFHSFLFLWMLIVEASEVADRFPASLLFIKAWLWHTFESLIDSGCQPDWSSSHPVFPNLSPLKKSVSARLAKRLLIQAYLFGAECRLRYRPSFF